MYFKAENESLNGMFTYIYNNYRENLASILSFSSSEIPTGRGNAEILFDPNNNGDNISNNFHTINITNSFVQVSFKHKRVILSHYTLMSRNENLTKTPQHCGAHLIQWKLEASNDKRKWEELHVQNKTDALSGQRLKTTCQCTKLGSYKHFRLTNTGGTSSSKYDHYLILHRMEIFGELEDFRANSCKYRAPYVSRYSIIMALIIIDTK